jgi:ABC-2 type transport system permease protein
MATNMIAIPAPRGGVPRTFWAICVRDFFVLSREAPGFLIQVALQPLFLAFIFGRVLPQIGLARPSLAVVLLPGLVGLTAVLTALQSVALPMVLEFGYTKEIEDRLLAPLPVALVGVQKIVGAAVRGVLGAAIVLPLAWLIMGWNSVQLQGDHILRFHLFLVLGALLGSTLGLTLGTLVEPRHINVVFTLVFVPLFFTGCVQYPWATLDSLEWFKWVTAVNPMTYVSEGLRSSVVPVPHMQPWIAAVVLVAWIAALAVLGIRGFRRRAVD